MLCLAITNRRGRWSIDESTGQVGPLRDIHGNRSEKRQSFQMSPLGEVPSNDSDDAHCRRPVSEGVKIIDLGLGGNQSLPRGRLASCGTKGWRPADIFCAGKLFGADRQTITPEELRPADVFRFGPMSDSPHPMPNPMTDLSATQSLITASN